MKKELIKKEEVQKEELEKEKKSLEKLKNINKKRESYSIYAKNNPINQKEQASNNGNKNIKEMSEDSSNGPQKRTLKDSELEQEFLIINESNNNEIIQIDNKNNYINDIDEKDINNYQKLNDKEVSNKIKYELEKDLLNKQKRNYNMMILNGMKNRSQDMKNYKNKNLIELNKEPKRNKLCLLDLENNKEKKIKEIEDLLKDGIDEKKLKQLEYTYKDNKEIMSIINKYKEKKLNLENNNILMEEPLSDSVKIINVNKLRKSKSTIDENVLRLKDNKSKIRIPKNSQHINMSVGNPINQYNNQSSSSIQDYCDLSPFYYISNGNKLSKNMWGFNEKYQINNFLGQSKYTISQEQIIQNKLKIYKDRMYKPFLDKVEKEKNKEFRRVQILKKINDPKIKNNLETKFGIERGKVDLELTKEKKKINRAIRDYENQLIINENENQKALEQNNIFFD